MLMTPAAKRYNVRFLLCMVAYAVLLSGATWTMKHYASDGPVLVLLTIIATLPIAASLLITGIYLLEETDEYVKQRTVTAMLFGIGVVLSISTALGFLQQRDVIGSVDLLWAFPLWCVLWGLAQCWMAWRDYRSESEA